MIEKNKTLQRVYFLIRVKHFFFKFQLDRLEVTRAFNMLKYHSNHWFDFNR